MQVDWVRRFQGLWLGYPPTRAGDLFEIKRTLYVLWQHRGPPIGFLPGYHHRRTVEMYPLERGDLVLVLQNSRDIGFGLLLVRVGDKDCFVEPMDIWEHGRLIG